MRKAAPGLRYRMFRARSEEGFSLIEAMAALFVAAIVIGASVATAISGYRAVRSTKFFQQGTALGNEFTELARDLQYDELNMQTSDLTGDTRITGAGTCGSVPGTHYFDPDSTGPMTCEAIVNVASGAGIADHQTTEDVGGKTYTVSRYVTWVDADTQGSTGQDYKRVSTVVEWTTPNGTKSFRTSTNVSQARRGLPVPGFTLSPTTLTTKTQTAGQSAVFPHTVVNEGITDAYDIILTGIPGGWTTAIYADAGTIGTYDAGTDVLLTDTNGSGVVDTGNTATDEVFEFLVVVAIPGGTATGNYNFTVTARSGADSTVTAVSPDRVTVGVAGLTYYLHNNPTPPTANTTAVSYLTMNSTAPTAATLFRYSTNHHNADSGRYLDKSSISDTQSDNKLMAAWRFQVSAASTYTGAGEVRLWNMVKGFACDKALVVQVYVRHKASNDTTTGTAMASASLNIPAPGGAAPCAYRESVIPLTFTGTSVAANRWIELKVEVNTTGSGDAGLFAYDTTAFPSRLILPTPTNP